MVAVPDPGAWVQLPNRSPVAEAAAWVLGGSWAGTGFAASALEGYADKMANPNTRWYGKILPAAGGALSAAWQPNNWYWTAMTLGGAYGVRNAGTVWNLADGTSARTVVDYGNLVRVERHMIGKGVTRGMRWHMDGLWGKIRHWPWGF